ncbi:hypothetical protein, partial [Streptomyces griseoruber]|uniref:hypothetical protein n=1 Tax=Streptomyces griseoruber TaxID=1943 RepID=UPI0019824A3B
MEPTESAAPDSRLRRLRGVGVRWGSRWAGRSWRHPGAEAHPPRTTPDPRAPTGPPTGTASG